MGRSSVLAVMLAMPDHKAVKAGAARHVQVKSDKSLTQPARLGEQCPSEFHLALAALGCFMQSILRHEAVHASSDAVVKGAT